MHSCHFHSLCRKRVSTSLASDFCNKMNQLILSFIQRRDQYCSDENFAENMDYPFWQQSIVYQNAEPIESDSSSMVPLQYYNLQTPEKWQNASFTGQSSQNVVTCFTSLHSHFHEKILVHMIHYLSAT